MDSINETKTINGGKTVIRGSVPQRDKEKEQMKQTYNDCYLPIKPMMIFNDYLYSQ